MDSLRLSLVHGFLASLYHRVWNAIHPSVHVRAVDEKYLTSTYLHLICIDG